MDGSLDGDLTAHAAPRQTRFSDVCGTIDELKRMLYEEPEAAAAAPEQLIQAVDEAVSMEDRMRLRLREYEQFRDELVALADALKAIESPRRQEATAEAAVLRERLRCGRPLTEPERAEVVIRAEEVRDVAQHLENTLYRYKDVTLAVGRAYRAIQGDRGWVLDESEAQEAEAEGEHEWAQWLPISPHRERIVRYLRAGRAHLLPTADGDEPGQNQAPLIQFEDGGMMPLPAVRWSDELGNFYPADQPPHPRGLDYRDRRG